MKKELKSIQHVWKLVDLPEGFKPIDCKWLSKTKKYYKEKLISIKQDMLLKNLCRKN